MSPSPLPTRPLRRVVAALAAFVLCALGLGAVPATAGVNTWSGGGPEAGWPETIAIAPSNPSVIYVGVENGRGVFKSADGGATWRDVSTSLLATHAIGAVAVDPTNPNRAWVSGGNGPEQGIYRTTNGGTSWTEITDPAALDAPVNADSLAVDPTNGDILYASGFGTVHKSVNGGDDWTNISAGLPSWVVFSLAVDPRDPDTLWAGVQVDGMWMKDGANPWVKRGTTTKSVVDVAMAPTADPNRSLAIGAVFNGGVISVTFAGTQTQLDDTDLNSTGFTTAVAAHPTNANILYAAADGFSGGGVYRTTDGGEDWTLMDLGSGEDQQFIEVAVNPSTPTTVFAGGRGHGIFKSSNSGDTWSLASEGFVAGLGTEVVVHPTDPSTAYIGLNGGGVFKTTNAGRDWVARNNGLDGMGVFGLAMDPSAPDTLYAATFANYVFKTTDGGANWVQIKEGMTESQVSDVLVARADPQTVYSVEWFSLGMHSSTNGGANWAPTTGAGLTGSTARSLVDDPRDDLHLYVVTSNGVFETFDGGANWIGPRNNGMLGSIGPATTIDIAASAPDVLYAAAGPDLYRTADGGDNWALTDVADQVIQQIVVDPNDAAIVYIVVNGQVFRSVDSGDNFVAMNAGLGPRFVNDLAVHPDGISSYVATGGWGGLHFLTDTVAPPRPTMTKPTAVPQLQRNIRLAWSSSDTPGGVASHAVRYRQAKAGTNLGAHKVWKSAITSRSATFPGAPGSTYCFSVRTKDLGGLVSPWSKERCAGLPVDDRGLDPTGPWKRKKASGNYLNTFSSTTRKGAKLSLEGAKATRIGLVATTCPRCGVVKVLLGKKLLKKISLKSSKTQKRRYIPVAKFGSVRSGTVRIVVVSSGKPVIVDGLGVFKA